MTDAATGSVVMEVEDSSENPANGSVHIEKNGVSKDKDNCNKSPHEADNAATEDVPMINFEDDGGDSITKENKDVADNVEMVSAESKLDESKLLNGAGGESSATDNPKEGVADENNGEVEAMEVDAGCPPSIESSEKQLSVVSPKPYALHDLLAENPPKDSPAVIGADWSPFVKDRGESYDALTPRNENEDEATSKADMTDTTEEIQDSKEKENGTEPKEKNKSGKKKKGKLCAECGKKKKLDFRIAFHGEVYQLCSEVCYKDFKAKKAVIAPVVPKIFNENCGQCQGSIENGRGFFPAIGKVKALCSDECVKRYHEIHGKIKNCNQCMKQVDSVYNRLTWETMTFCSEECLGIYQAQLGSHCTSCQSPVQQNSLGKYCVCFGADIRQFCSGTCLEDFKKALKVCCYCQTDLSTVGEGFLAPVGENGTFKDFCTQNCMERCEEMTLLKKSVPWCIECGHCNTRGSYKIKVKYDDKSYYFCSEKCVCGFRCLNQITNNICATCFKFFPPSEHESFNFMYEDTPKHFCSKPCMTLFVLSNRKICQCHQCKVKKYNFDMIEKIDALNRSNVFCSLNCLSVYRVDQIALSSQRVRCAHCSKSAPAQYHLTMSDGSVHNFCNYDCVMANQDEAVVSAIQKTVNIRNNSNTARTVNAKPTPAASTNPSPIIANVISLSQARPATPPQSRSILPQTIVSVRPQRPGVSVLSSKPQASSPSVKPSVSVSVAQTLTSGLNEIIVRPPTPRTQRNKAASVKPIMQTKGVCVRSQTCHKAVQTDETQMPAILPVPFPIYVPSCGQMYSRTIAVPVPFPVPVPIPVPIFIKDKSSLKSNDAALLSVATKSAEAMKIIAESNKNWERLGISTEVASTTQDPKESSPAVASISPDPKEAVNNIHQDPPIITQAETSIPQTSVESESITMPTLEKKDSSLDAKDIMPIIEPKIEPMDDDDDDTLLDSKPFRKKKRSGEDIVVEEAEAKRIKMDDELETIYGLNAWRQWVIMKNGHTARGNSKKSKSIIKQDILLLQPFELNNFLSLFVKEVARPNGQPYTAGALFYLLLGIQLHLNDNGKALDIFSDETYASFAEHFHDVLLQYESRALNGDAPWSRIKEEYLWDSKQLGAQSPQILLNTLIYFNTKYFKIRSSAAHMAIQFGQIKRHTDDTGSYLRFHGSYSNGEKDPDGYQAYRENHFIQPENNDDQLRCPVRLFEFYISKCQPSSIENNSKFYCQVAENYSPNSEYWFTDTPLSEKLINEQLLRIQFIEEAGIDLIYSGYQVIKPT